MFSRILCAALAGLALAPLEAAAHCFVGARFLPATLTIDDPCVADELSLPTVARFNTGDDPSARQLDISGEYSKRITDTFGVSIGRTWTHLSQPAGMPDVSGFQNWETTFKHQFLTDAAHEFVALVLGCRAHHEQDFATRAGGTFARSWQFHRDRARDHIARFVE